MSEVETMLRGVPVGPELARVLAGLGPVPRRLVDAAGVREVVPDAGDQLLVLQKWQQHQAWVDAQLNAALLQVVGSRLGPDDEDWGREEAAAALSWPGLAVSGRVEVARVLAGRCFLTRRALEEGRITYRHAEELVRALEPLDDEAAAAVEGRLLDWAGKGKTVAQLRRKARTEVAKADPAGADERHKRARKGRRVTFTPTADGMGELLAHLPADQLVRVQAAVQSLSGLSRGAGDGRTLAQRYADALVVLVEVGLLTVSGVLPAPAVLAELFDGDNRAPSAVGRPDAKTTALLRKVLAGKRATPARIALTVPLSTVLGVSNEPGELTGYGPVPACLAREVAADGRWEKWITDARGVVTDLGRTAYRPSAELAALVRATYPRCVFPTCSQPSHRCDLDHNVRRIDGGDTSLANMVPLCRRHHRAKDEAGWELHHDPVTGSCTWTSPRGRIYVVDPPDQGEETEPLVVPADWTKPLAPEPALVGAPAPVEMDDPPPF